MKEENQVFLALFNYHRQICDCNNYHTCFKTYRRCLIGKKIYHSLQYGKRKNAISYFIKYATGGNSFEFGSIQVFFQYKQQTYALIQNFQHVNAFSDYLKESLYYDLLKQSIDTFYFVLKKTNINRFVLAKNIEKHMIIFQGILDKSLILATPISSITEHD